MLNEKDKYITPIIAISKKTVTRTLELRSFEVILEMNKEINDKIIVGIKGIKIKPIK
jgi:hypothetical protein